MVGKFVMSQAWCEAAAPPRLGHRPAPFCTFARHPLVLHPIPSTRCSFIGAVPRRAWGPLGVFHVRRRQGVSFVKIKAGGDAHVMVATSYPLRAPRPVRRDRPRWIHVLAAPNLGRACPPFLER